MHYADKPKRSPRGVIIGRERGVTVGSELTLFATIYALRAPAAFEISGVTASDAGTAGTILEAGQRRVACVICDHMMEMMSGLDLLRLVRTGRLKGVVRNLSFTVLTGAGSNIVSAAAKVLECNAYVAKPVTKDGLVKAIRRAMAYRPSLRPAKDYDSLPLPQMS
jgi:CheY-like chemotaxis protein